MRRMAFLKKELVEILKTPKIIILPSIFLFIGLVSALTGRYMNELIASMSDLNIQLPEPVYLDSYAQLFKNLSMMGVIVVILTFMGIVVDEKVKGSAILVLTKSVSRTQFILSKLAASVLLFTVSYLLAVLGCVYYTYVLFPQFSNEYLPITLALFWIYGLFIIAATILASTISKSHTMAAVLGFLSYALVSALAAFPKIGTFSPGALPSLGLGLLSGTMKLSDMTGAVLVTLGAFIAIIAASIALFKRQEL
jgi:ABC-2 type transport system permease protein